ncbi:MAG: LysM peptidoglycan-binding domain-containing protein [Bacteroidetes bacterium]|nr:LysM peptidoglycan-binding domain-containing protein [Bacteroidota bacterium]
MKLQRDMNAASKALGSKAVDFSFQIPNLEQSIALGTLPTMPNMNGSGQSTKTYQVRKGDTLSSIAQRYDMAWEDLWNLNKGNLQSGDPNLIYPNEVLNIPSNAKVTPTVSKAVPQPNFKWSTASVNAYVYSPIATSDPSLGIRNTSPEAKLILRNQRLNNLAEQYPIQAERGRIGLPEKSNMIGQNQQGAMYFQNGAYLYEMYSKKMGTGSNYYKYNSSAKKWELYQTEDNYTNAKNQGIVQFYETWANITVGVLIENLGIAFKGEELIAKSLAGRELLRNPLSIYGQRFSEIGTPSSDKINVIGKYSNRLFNPNNAGGKILNLNWRNTKFTKDGVDAVKNIWKDFDTMEKIQREFKND